MRIPVTNNTKMPIYCGSSMIPPGETRDFEEHQVPMHLRPKAAVTEPKPEVTEAESLANFRARSVKEIVADLDNVPDDKLADLEAAENADAKPRKGLIDAIAALRLQRAANPSPGSDQNLKDLTAFRSMSVEEITAQMVDLSDEWLSALEEMEKADPNPRLELLEAISQAITARADTA